MTAATPPPGPPPAIPPALPPGLAQALPVSGTAAPMFYGIDLGIALEERRVLIVDDNAFDRRTLTRFLHWAGLVRVHCTPDASQTLDRVAADPPDLILLDNDMAHTDGIALCRHLRADPRCRDLPILLLSTDNSDPFRTAGFQAGATDVISKPVNPGEFIARVRHHLERRALVSELRAFRERVERDLLKTRSMQLALVPEPRMVDAIGERHGLWIDPLFRTSDEIGGDFWTVFELDRERVGVFVADFSGHGIAAAINAFRLHTLLARIDPDERSDPAALLALINLRLCDILPVGQFATAFYAIVDRTTDTLRYAAAGAPSPFLGTADGFRALDASGLFLGAFPEAEYESATLPFGPGQSLFLYSDALTEACDADGAMLGEDGLIRLVEEAAMREPRRPVAPVIEAFTRRFGERLQDDLTAVWLARR